MRASLRLAVALAVSMTTVSAQIQTHERRVHAEAFFLDSVWGEDPVSDSETVESSEAGVFQADVEANAGALGSETYADADQQSQSNAIAFDGDGVAAAGLYVQGQGHAIAESRFEVTFDLPANGALLLVAELSNANTFEGFFSHDDHGTSSASVRIEDAVSGIELFAIEAVFGGPDVDYDDVLPLGAGSYRLTIEAHASDETTGIDQVNGSMAAATWFVEGRLEMPGATALYGCGLNPAGSLSVLSGSAHLGQTLVLGVDDPTGTSTPGSVALVALALGPDPAFPCGTPLPGFGMSGGAGELLISVAPPNPLTPLVIGAAWSGAGSPAAVPIAIGLTPGLAGVTVYAQGLLADGGNVGLADAFAITIGA